MAVKYRLVQRKDLSKGAGKDDRLFYASANVTGTTGFEAICEQVADRSTASDGDVALVLLGLIRCMEESLLRGEVVQLGALGNFQLVIGSSGTKTEKEFLATLIRKPRIVFRPGVRLREMINKVSFERIAREEQKPTEGGSESESPDEV